MGTHETYSDCKIYLDGKPYDFDVEIKYEQPKGHFLESPSCMTAEIDCTFVAPWVTYLMKYFFQNNWRKQHGLPMIRRKAWEHVHR